MDTGFDSPLIRHTTSRVSGKSEQRSFQSYRVRLLPSCLIYYVPMPMVAAACVFSLNKKNLGLPSTHTRAAHPKPAPAPSTPPRLPSPSPPRPGSLLWLWLMFMVFVGGARSFFRSFTRRTRPNIRLRPPLRPAFKSTQHSRLAAAATMVSDRKNRVALAGALVVEVLVHITAMTCMCDMST